MRIAQKKSFFLYLLASLVWMAVIYSFSQQANSGRVTEAYFHAANVPVRKLAHMSEYCLLFLFYRNTLKEVSRLGERSLALALILAILYAVSDEWHQAYVPGRSASMGDVLVDSCGALIALGFVWARRKFFAPE